MRIVHAGKRFRAVFIALPERKQIAIHDVVKKDDSEDGKQNRVLLNLQNSPRKHFENAVEKLEEGEPAT